MFSFNIIPHGIVLFITFFKEMEDVHSNRHW